MKILRSTKGTTVIRPFFEIIIIKGIPMSVNEVQNKHGLRAFILALISFIPLIGLFTGVICIVIAVVGKKSNSKLLGWLGCAGIIFSVVLYGSLFYKMFNDEEFTKGLEKHAASAMTSLIPYIEYYKLQNGSYPDSMQALREQLTGGEITFTYDMSVSIKTKGQQREFYYELVNDGKNYLLFAIGQDSMPFTADDIFPLLDPEKDKNNGWVLEK